HRPRPGALLTRHAAGIYLRQLRLAPSHAHRDDIRMTVPLAGPAYQGLSRTIQIPACVLSIEDLRRLFIDLDALTREVTSVQIDGLKQPANTTPADFKLLKEQAKREAGLNMFVQGKNGEQVVLHSAAA